MSFIASRAYLVSFDVDNLSLKRGTYLTEAAPCCGGGGAAAAAVVAASAAVVSVPGV